jgi:signal transduction histidine kinase
MRSPANENPLAPASLVGDLPTSECYVALNAPCKKVYARFVSDALIPGVVVLGTDGDIRGLMSRHRFMEVFSQTYRSEVYFSRPLELLLREEFAVPLCVPSDASIAAVAEAALQRPRDRFNEPVAVAYPGTVFKVLEMRDLLLALANIQTYQYQQLQVALNSLVQAEKLASLGGLVAGVAHEINTPVGVSLSAASHLVDQVDHFSKLLQRQQIRKADLESFVQGSREASGIILHNMERAAALVRSFKQVAVDQTSETRRRFDLQQTVGEILFNLGPSFKHSAVELRQNVEGGIAMDCYPGALAQILSNLVLNGLVHGFDDAAPGTIEVLGTHLANGQDVEISVRDNGRGIAPPVLGRVFDPFFTTRRNQGGTGLGLHIVYNLVRNTLGGSITVHSTVGQSTCFTIRIPRVAPYH